MSEAIEITDALDRQYRRYWDKLEELKAALRSIGERRQVRIEERHHAERAVSKAEARLEYAQRALNMAPHGSAGYRDAKDELDEAKAQHERDSSRLARIQDEIRQLQAESDRLRAIARPFGNFLGALIEATDFQAERLRAELEGAA